jgi:hypothetical protein
VNITYIVYNVIIISFFILLIVMYSCSFLLLLFIIYFLLMQILGFTNPTPLKNNLVLEICKRKDIYTHIVVGTYAQTKKSEHDA